MRIEDRRRAQYWPLEDGAQQKDQEDRAYRNYRRNNSVPRYTVEERGLGGKSFMKRVSRKKGKNSEPGGNCSVVELVVRTLTHDSGGEKEFTSRNMSKKIN